MLLLIVSSLSLRHLLRAAVRRPGQAARGPRRHRGAGRARAPPATATTSPCYEQYWSYIEGDRHRPRLRYLDISNTPVKDRIIDRLPATISLALGAVVVWLRHRLPRRHRQRDSDRRSLLDRPLMGGALIAISAPVYWLGLVCALPVRRGPRAVPAPARTGHATCRSSEDFGTVVHVADPAVVRAGRVVRRDLRAAAALAT